jgi:hypothetical protein
MNHETWQEGQNGLGSIPQQSAATMIQVVHNTYRIGVLLAVFLAAVSMLLRPPDLCENEQGHSRLAGVATQLFANVLCSMPHALALRWGYHPW